MSKRIKFFKITGILMIIAGSGSILVGLLTLAAGIFLVFGNLDNPGEIGYVLGRFAGTGIAIALAGGVVQFITGIYSIKNYKIPEKANTFIHLGTLTAILFVVSQVWDIMSVGFHNYTNNVLVYVGMVIPALYVISSVQLKVTEEPQKHHSVELPAFLAFFVRRKERIFEILFTLILCGVIGWIFETVEVWIHFGTLTARGMLFISRINGFPILWGLPFILMYGIGGAILIWCFKPLKDEPVRLFFIGMFILTVFEYATSVFCEDVLHMTLWDYSKQFMNFQGRVCLSSSLAWGILSVISVKLLAPLFDRIYNAIKSKHILHISIIILLLFIIVCYILRPYLNVEQY